MEQTIASKNSFEIYNNFNMWNLTSAVFAWQLISISTHLPVYLFSNFHFWLGLIANFLAKNLDLFGKPVAGRTYSCLWHRPYKQSDV